MDVSIKINFVVYIFANSPFLSFSLIFSMEGSPRMISTPQFQPVTTPSNNPTVSLGKKTIRNYTPKESSNMLREFEDRRNNSVDWRGNKHSKNPKSSKPSIERKSSMDRLIDDFHRSLPAPLDSNSNASTNKRSSGQHPPVVSGAGHVHGTMTSQISNWSAASSAASFDYQPANKNNAGSPSLPSVHEEDHDEQHHNHHHPHQQHLHHVHPHGERIPPEGAAAPGVPVGASPTNFVQRIEVKSAKRSPSPQKTVPNKSSSAKPERAVKKTSAKIEDPQMSVNAQPLVPAPVPPPPPPPAPLEEDEPAADDGFDNLRRLISEGRISGLNEKPPSFVPPSPPASGGRRGSVERSASSSRRSPSVTKPPAPSTPNTKPSGGGKATHSAERQPSRKNREAPKPPGTTQSNVSTPNSDVKFVASRQRESMEDLTQMNSKKRSEVKRSSSNHGSRPSGMLNCQILCNYVVCNFSQ